MWNGGTVGYTYHAAGERTGLSYPDGAQIAYIYTDRGQVASIGAPGVEPLVRYEYDAKGLRTAMPYANNVLTQSEYDAVGNLLTLSRENGQGTELALESYSYDANGNRVAAARQGIASSEYAYDAVNQLTSSSTNDGQAISDTNYAWDKVGNRQTVTANGNNTNYSVNSLNQYTAMAGKDAEGNSVSELPSYDRNGNVMGYNGYSYTYDNRNRLTKVTGSGVNATLEYDYRNRVIARTINGEARYYVYDGWSVIAEYGRDNQMKAKYVNGSRLDEVILTINGKGIFFHHHDALGSETQLTDVNGKVLESYTYSDFGIPTVKNSSGNVISASTYDNRSLFTSRTYWPELGIYDYRNRVYSSELGRFLQTDPMRFDAGDVNIYRYCGNNPIGFVDPWGLLVTGTYDNSTGTLVMTNLDDNHNGTYFDTIITTARSGGDMGTSPIPNGTYEILDQARRDNYYRLDAIDSSPRNDICDDTGGRGQFRLHEDGGTSYGCVSITSRDGSRDVCNMLNNTSSGGNVNTVNQTWHGTQSDTSNLYGTITVQNSVNYSSNSCWYKPWTWFGGE